MDIKIMTLFSLTAFKITSLIVGLLITYMGYKLFTKGIWGHSGEIDGEFSDFKIVVRKAAPGTFFALFGALVIVFAILKGIVVDMAINDNNSSKIEKPKLPDQQPF